MKINVKGDGIQISWGGIFTEKAKTIHKQAHSYPWCLETDNFYSVSLAPCAKMH